MKALQCAKMSGTSHPMTQRHNPDGSNHLKLFIMITSYKLTDKQTNKQTNKHPTFSLSININVPEKDGRPTTANHLRSVLVK